MKKTRVRRNTLAMAAASALAAPLHGWAVDEPDAAGVLPPIVVKGEKIERRSDETMSSVSVNTARDLREHADKSLADVLTRTPGVYTTAGNENWGIRGVPVSGFDDQGPATLNGAVSVYVDGAPQPNRTLTLSPLLLWDIDQVEILRGPQSTEQGRNSLAGAVVVQTKKPSYQPSLAMQLNAGNLGERGAAAAVGGSLVDGFMAGRLAVDYQESDGYIHNPTLDKDADAHRSANVRGKVLIQPSDRLDILLSLTHIRNRQGDNSVAQDSDQPQYFQLRTNTDAFDRIRQDTATARLDYILNSAWTLSSTTATTHSGYDALLDFDENATDRMEVVRRQEGRMSSEELRLAYQGTALRGHLGAYYGRTPNRFDDRLAVDAAPFGRVAGETRLGNQAVFGGIDWNFTPDWQLAAGLRYDRERNETHIVQDDFSSPGQVGKTFHATLPKLGLSYLLSADQRVGATVQKGYRSGGVNVRAGAGHAAYDPEYTDNLELSYRGSFLDKRLRVSGNAYYTRWKDQQVSMLVDTGGVGVLEVRNAASSRMKGLEASVDYELSRAWSLSTGMSYNDARYRRFVQGDGDDLSGQAFLYAPKSVWTLGTRYRLGGLNVNADVVYRQASPSEYLLDADGRVVGVRRGDSHTLLNLNADYRLTANLTLGAYVKNLFDERYVINNRSGSTVDAGSPRRFGAVLRYEM